jgi:hypothetical protein
MRIAGASNRADMLIVKWAFSHDKIGGTTGHRPQFPVDCGMANRRSSHEQESQDQGAEGR